MDIRARAVNHTETTDFKNSEPVGKTDGWRTEPDSHYTDSAGGANTKHLAIADVLFCYAVMIISN